MTDETRPDREALRVRVAATLCRTIAVSWDDAEYLHLADAVLALLPAPHPQCGTEALRAGIKALCDKAERHAWQEDDRWVSERALRALLAAAPAPTAPESVDEA